MSKLEENSQTTISCDNSVFTSKSDEIDSKFKRFTKTSKPAFPESVINPMEEKGIIARSWDCLVNSYYMAKQESTLDYFDFVSKKQDGTCKNLSSISNLKSSVGLVSHPCFLNALWSGEDWTDPDSKMDERMLREGIGPLGFSIKTSNKEDYMKLRRVYKVTTNSASYMNQRQKLFEDCSKLYIKELIKDSGNSLEIIERYSMRTMASIIINPELSSPVRFEQERVDALYDSVKKFKYFLRMTLFGVPPSITSVAFYPSRKLLTDAGLEVENSDQSDPNANTFGKQIKVKTQDGEYFTFSLQQSEELVGMALVGGLEEITASIYHIIYSLGRNPKILNKLKEEIAFKKLDNTEKESKYLEDSDTYFECIIWESLRLFPPAYVVTRTMKEDVYINDIETKTSTQIKKDTNLLMSFSLINKNPDFWGKDSKDFKPERFAENQSLKTNRCVPSFGGVTGNNCPGQKLASRAIKTFIYHLVNKVETISSEENTGGMRATGTLFPNVDYEFSFKKIQS